ncbi:MAG: exo-alpha-sialidase [Candidatus Hydrogenedentes bacterium]|nr:exo-alpha-sialidase [Candidatus Hydrogenedentota bacterium]
MAASPVSAQAWSPPLLLTDDGETFYSGYYSNPSMTSDGHGNWVAVMEYILYRHSSGDTERKIICSTSSDDGETWSTPEPFRLVVPGSPRVESGPNPALPAKQQYPTLPGNESCEFHPQIATDGQGLWIALWLVYSFWDLESLVVCARSLDNGLTWSQESLVGMTQYCDPAEELCFPARLAAGDDGIWIAVWKSGSSSSNPLWRSGDYIYSRSIDGGLTWSDAAALNSTAISNQVRDYDLGLTTDRHGLWMAVYSSTIPFGDFSYYDRRVVVSRSTDGGLTWSAPAQLSPESGVGSGQNEAPRLAANGENTWLATWESTSRLEDPPYRDYGIQYARSTDGGLTWSVPAALKTNALINAGYDDLHSLSSDEDGVWLAAWSSDDSLSDTVGRDADILSSRSLDDGITWSPPAALNTNAAIDYGVDYSASVLPGRAGRWIATWTSTDTLGGTLRPGTRIFSSHSGDHGATWSAPEVFSAPPQRTAGYDGAPILETDRQRLWVLAWSSDNALDGSIGFDYDILYSRSLDGGETWSAPAPLNSNAATDESSDYAPSLATDASGTWMAVWSSYDSLNGTLGLDADILYARSLDGGLTWGAPSALNTNAGSDEVYDGAPLLATDNKGLWVAVWTSRIYDGSTLGSDSDLLFSRSLDDGHTWSAPSPLNGNFGSDIEEDYPTSLSTDNAGLWIILWTQEYSPDSHVMYSRSPDGGQTWSAPARLDVDYEDYYVDFMDNRRGVLSTDGNGLWLAAWSRFLPNPYGSRYPALQDVLFSRSSDGGVTWSTPAILRSGPEMEAWSDSCPSLTNDGRGSWMAVWQTAGGPENVLGTDPEIVYARSVDGGVTWAEPAVLNSNASVDADTDRDPHLITDRQGRWITVWTHESKLDTDIYLSTHFAEVDTGEGEGEGEDVMPDLEELRALIMDFAATDANGDERLSFPEASAAMNSLTAAQFQVLDRNGDAYLTQTELQDYIGEFSSGQGCYARLNACAWFCLDRLAGDLVVFLLALGSLFSISISRRIP